MTHSEEANNYDPYKPYTDKNYLNYNASLFKFLSNIPPGARLTWIIYDETPIYSGLIKEMQTHG